MVDRIYEATNGSGVDVLLEMAGHPNGIRDGFTVLKNAGHAVILGLSSATKIELDWTNLVFKGVTIYFRYGRHLYRTWSDGRNLLESGLVDLEPLIYKPHFKLDDYAKAFQMLKDGDAAKVIFEPNGQIMPASEK